MFTPDGGPDASVLIRPFRCKIRLSTLTWWWASRVRPISLDSDMMLRLVDDIRCPALVLFDDDSEKTTDLGQ